VTPVEEVAETGLDGVVTVDEEAEEVSSWISSQPNSQKSKILKTRY